MERDGFIFYSSFLEAIDLLPDEQKLKAYESICKYGIRGEVPNGDGAIPAIIELIKNQIDESCERIDYLYALEDRIEKEKEEKRIKNREGARIRQRRHREKLRSDDMVLVRPVFEEE